MVSISIDMVRACFRLRAADCECPDFWEDEPQHSQLKAAQATLVLALQSEDWPDSGGEE